MANERLLFVQIGKETTAFTAVAATARLSLIDPPKFKHEGMAEVLYDQAGSFSPGSVAVFNGAKGSVSLSGVATYQDLPFYLDSLLGVVAPSGAGPYVYAYSAPLTAMPTLRRNTFEFGDAQSGGPAYKMAGGLLNKFSLSTKPNESAKFSAEFLTAGISTVTLAALSTRTQTPLHNSQLVAYLDAWGGTMGATTLTATAIEFSLDVDAKRELAFMSADLAPTDHDEDTLDIKFKATLKFNATSKAVLDEIISASAVTQRQVRLKFTTGATAIAQFDIPILIDPGQDLFGNRNKTLLLDVSGTSMYQTTVANYFKASITNQVSTLP
jgi:hypothetical protein